MAATRLPLDVEREILLRLPARSLRRVKYVCKSWNSIITDVNFLAAYRRRHVSNSGFMLLRHHARPLSGGEPNIYFSLSDESFVERDQFCVPLLEEEEFKSILHAEPSFNQILSPNRVELVGSSINGLYCILISVGKRYEPMSSCNLYLWNPSIGKSKCVLQSDYNPNINFYLGFGYHEQMDDYKIVKISYPISGRFGDVEVFSLKTNSWRRKIVGNGGGSLSNMLWATSTSTFVNGACHWGVYTRENKARFCILAYDLHGNTCQRLVPPENCVDGRELRFSSLWVYMGLLSISVLHFGGFDSATSTHDIWVMTDYAAVHSWAKVLTIDLDGGPRRPVLMGRNGEVLMLGDGDDDHVIYEPQKEEQVKSLGIIDVEAIAPYMESLVLL
ncbi:hypothetical protein Nepgr_017624 [Nepenthes gracilis]|uniref:F-box domain-containing protein n=1 Tax=Nepenthes gracilis TaxID=150966 RepID=A0AAD3SPQ0_NEPGR|nr:hypothetical protein Nepgr_017624 [Nepenthes gracilis]